VLQILRAIRILVRQYPHACAVVSLAPHLSSDSWGGPGWTHKVGWLSDGCLTLAAFTGVYSVTRAAFSNTDSQSTADLALSAAFPTHHGLVHLHSLPAPHSLVAPSDRFSALRGLSASGENNLGFRVTRKRLVFETVHLDVEGGVGERRTTPAPVALEHAPHAHAHGHPPELGRAATAIEVSVESAGPTASLLPAPEPQGGGDGAKPKKARKKVAFHADRPDLYDF
jgi:elongator complex protein 4